MPQRTSDTNAKRKPSPSVPGGAGGTIVALLVFGAGLATCVVGLVQYYSANREEGVVAAVPSEPSATDKPGLTTELVPPAPKPALNIPVPDDIKKLDADVRQELRLRLQRARQSDQTPGQQADFVDALGRLGAFYEAYGYSSHALDCYALAVDADPEGARWKYHWAVLSYARGDNDAAVESMRQVIQRDAAYGPAHERLGMMLLTKGAYAEADQSFQRVVESHPEATSGYIGRGRSLLATDRLEEAVEQFRLALDKDMSSGQAHYLLGQTYQRLGRTRSARNEFARGARSAVDRLPDPWRSELTSALVGPKARLSFARYLAKSDRLRDAIILMTELHSVFPLDVDVANSLAVAHLQDGHPELALPVLHAAADTGRRSYLTYAHLATTLIKMGELDAALDFAVEATEISPMTARGYFVKGQALYAMERDEEALVAFRKARELDPRQGEVHFRLGLTAARLGRHNDAIESLETAAEFSPDSVIPLYNLGMIHGRAGRYDLAADALERALKIDPFDSKVRTALRQVERGKRNR